MNYCYIDYLRAHALLSTVRPTGSPLWDMSRRKTTPGVVTLNLKGIN